MARTRDKKKNKPANKSAGKKRATRPGVRKKASRNATARGAGPATAPCVAPGSPDQYRVRVRMYRQGLGDCFLITFPRAGRSPFQMLIDCGALARNAKFMTQIVRHIRDTVRVGQGKARLDVVVATHEHRDHLSGFNQAREVFSNDFDFGAVWLGWTENLSQPAIRKIKETKKRAREKLRAALDKHAVRGATLDGVAAILGFSEDDDTTGSVRIAEALAYLKLRGKEAGDLRYLEPGADPLELDGLADVRVFVLGPPRDPQLLKESKVTEQMKQEDVVYHLAATGEAGLEALSAAVDAVSDGPGADGDRYHPFAAEHRIAPTVPDPLQPNVRIPNPYFKSLRPFIRKTYGDADQKWRRIDHAWLDAFGQLALDLDSDTNNTSLVLAIEFVKTQEVLLFVGDAQVGNWRSWAEVDFQVPGRARRMPAHELLRNTVFYKVGHHCSHNATLHKGGLELMTRENLVAFVPLDKETARQQGRRDRKTGIPKGWDMPAKPLLKALTEKAMERVVISDVNERVSAAAALAGVIETNTYIDYFLK